MPKITVVLVFALLFVSLPGCGSATPSIADFEGEWKGGDKDALELSLDANGKGVVTIPFAYGKSMTYAEL